jgi:hypothetical protein
LRGLQPFKDYRISPRSATGGPTWTKNRLVREAGFTFISNNVCGVKAFFERRAARTPRSCFDSALVEELIIDNEGSHVICPGGTRSDPTISPIARSTMITASNFLVREQDAQSSGR